MLQWLRIYLLKKHISKFTEETYNLLRRKLLVIAYMGEDYQEYYYNQMSKPGPEYAVVGSVVTLQEKGYMEAGEKRAAMMTPKIRDFGIWRDWQGYTYQSKEKRRVRGDWIKTNKAYEGTEVVDWNDSMVWDACDTKETDWDWRKVLVENMSKSMYSLPYRSTDVWNSLDEEINTHIMKIRIWWYFIPLRWKNVNLIIENMRIYYLDNVARLFVHLLIEYNRDKWVMSQILLLNINTVLNTFLLQITGRKNNICT